MIKYGSPYIEILGEVYCHLTVILCSRQHLLNVYLSTSSEGILNISLLQFKGMFHQT